MESTDPPINDLECRDPAPLSIDRTISVVKYYSDAERNCKIILQSVGVSALLTILGFFIYQVLK